MPRPLLKSISLRYVLPLSFISFLSISKWWYALPVDGVDTLYWGFPFPYVGEGWHTSGSLQFFMLEGLLDFLIYFLILFFLVFGIRKCMLKWTESKVALRMTWAFVSLYLLGAGFILTISNPVFHLKRPYEWQVMESGLHLIWQQTPRPDIHVVYPGTLQPDSIQ